MSDSIARGKPSVLFLALAVIGHETYSQPRYFEYPVSLPGQILRAEKKFNPSTGRMEFLSSLSQVSSVADLLSLEAAEHAAARAAIGSLDMRLAEKISLMGAMERVRVKIRLKELPGTYLDKTLHSISELKSNAIALASLPTLGSMPDVLARHGVSGAGLPGMKTITVEVDKATLYSLKSDPEIAAVWEEVDEEPASSPEFSSLSHSAYNPGPVSSGSGSGVRAATFEKGLTSTFLSCIGASPSAYDPWDSGNPLQDVKRHSQATFLNLVNSAPSAIFYHRSTNTFNGTNDVNYLINNGIQTVSDSRIRGGKTPYRSTYSEFLTMDNFAYTYPYPVFVTPAANSGYQYEVNWQGYNAISVGNVRHTSNSTFEMAECTQTKNPPPVYGSCIAGSGPDCAGDRELPHVVVPGYPHTGTTFATTCLEGSGSLSCGTSWSAAIGNGTVASVIAADSRMISWPEKVRATLILTAQNVESGDWTISGDERDGTGVVSGSEAVSFAQNHTTVSPNNAAVVSGMHATSMYASDFGSNKRFSFLVPNPKPSGKHLRVVLTWDSNPDVNAGTNSLSDLDLIVQHNSGTSYSSSWDSNVEVVDIPAANLTAGNSYYIDVNPYMNRIPSSGTNYFYFAVAWTWVKDHAP